MATQTLPRVRPSAKQVAVEIMDFCQKDAQAYLDKNGYEWTVGEYTYDHLKLIVRIRITSYSVAYQFEDPANGDCATYTNRTQAENALAEGIRWYL